MNEKQHKENELYWQQRAEQRLISAEQKSFRLENDMKKQFDRAYKNIEGQIAKLYFKYADENELTYDEAIKYLNRNERKEFQKDLQFYIDKSKDAEYSEKFKSHLKALSTKARIKRLEELKLNIEYEVNELYHDYSLNTQLTFDDIINESYYKTIFDIQQFQGFGVAFNKISSNVLESLLEYPWSGKNYSEKIWTNIDNFSGKLEDVLTAGIIQGKSNQNMAAELQKATNTAYSNAIRLVRTETNYIAGEATHKAYQEYGVEKYQFLATLDLRTSEICRSLDGQVFEEKNRKAGVNCHPMHPHCRSTDIPYIPDLEGTRIARGSDGKSYKVDRNMTYKDWYQKYVENDHNELQAEKMIKNENSDKKQYEKYKDKLGNQAPKSFEKFQELKYNSGEGWTEIKKIYSAKSRELRKQDKGLSSNSKPNDITKSESIFIEKIDYNNTQTVLNKLSQYEDKIVNKPIEHAYVITKDNEVYEFIGDENSVNPLALGEKLKDSIITHNHPEDYTEYSFSKYDIDLLIKYNVKELHGIDHKYNYKVVNNGCTYEELEKHYNKAVINGKKITPLTEILENAMHNINSELSKLINISYERKMR